MQSCRDRWLGILVVSSLMVLPGHLKVMNCVLNTINNVKPISIDTSVKFTTCESGYKLGTFAAHLITNSSLWHHNVVST